MTDKPSTKVEPIPKGYEGATPYLIIKGAAKALEFYTKAFGATEIMRVPAPEGKVGHAEIKIGNAIIMLADEFPEMGAQSPKTIGGTPVTVMVYVDDVDTVFDRAVKAGATSLRPVEDKFYGDRGGEFEDRWGHRWSIATHIEDVAPDEMARRVAALEM